MHDQNKKFKGGQCWVQNPLWDSFWFLGGIWLIPVCLFIQIYPQFGLLFFSLVTPLLWISHRLASAYTAYCTPHYQELRKKEKIRFIVLPLSIFLLVFSFVFCPESWMPLSLQDKILILGTLFFLYNSYHFGIQHYGVISIYKNIHRHRSPFAHQNGERYLILILGCLLWGP